MNKFLPIKNTFFNKARPQPVNNTNCFFFRIRRTGSWKNLCKQYFCCCLQESDNMAKIQFLPK